MNYSVMEHAEFPHPLEDADQAMALIRQKAEDWNTDPGKIASIGFSAGGHLSGAMGTMGKERPNAMILGYPVTTPHKGAGLPYPIPGLCDKVDEHTVPAFLFATYDDQLVPVENTIKTTRHIAAKRPIPALYRFFIQSLPFGSPAVPGRVK